MVLYDFGEVCFVLKAQRKNTTKAQVPKRNKAVNFYSNLFSAVVGIC